MKTGFTIKLLCHQTICHSPLSRTEKNRSTTQTVTQQHIKTQDPLTFIVVGLPAHPGILQHNDKMGLQEIKHKTHRPLPNGIRGFMQYSNTRPTDPLTFIAAGLPAQPGGNGSEEVLCEELVVVVGVGVLQQQGQARQALGEVRPHREVGLGRERLHHLQHLHRRHHARTRLKIQTREYRLGHITVSAMVKIQPREYRLGHITEPAQWSKYSPGNIYLDI